MKQTIEIEVPDGKKAVWKDNKIVFENILPELPKTWEEFCEIKNIKGGQEYYITESSDIDLYIPRDYHKSKNLLPSIKAAEQHLALMQLHQLRDYYRQGWKPDWYNPKTTKVCIVQRSVGIYKIEPRDDFYPTFLSFKDKKTAEEFLKNFKNLIIQAGDFMFE